MYVYVIFEVLRYNIKNESLYIKSLNLILVWTYKGGYEW